MLRLNVVMNELLKTVSSHHNCIMPNYRDGSEFKNNIIEKTLKVVYNMLNLANTCLKEHFKIYILKTHVG